MRENDDPSKIFDIQKISILPAEKVDTFNLYLRTGAVSSNFGVVV